MEAILETVSRLQQVPVEGLEATLGVGAYANRFREDVVAPTLPREQALANAPAQRDGCFEIVRILSKTSEE
jgi:aspartyl-tRNA(Asn)/glutamyl-tRNA(Gln) amidotransferase subunit C